MTWRRTSTGRAGHPGLRADHRAQWRGAHPQRPFRSWLADGTPYGASKAALWSQTNSLRLELQPRGIAVTGLNVAYVDTDMTAGLDAPKADPRDVAVAALDGIEAGAHEVLADDTTRWVRSQLSADLEALYPQLNK